MILGDELHLRGVQLFGALDRIEIDGLLGSFQETSLVQTGSL